MFPLRPLSLLGSVRRREGKNQENAVQPTQDICLGKKAGRCLHVSELLHAQCRWQRGSRKGAWDLKCQPNTPHSHSCHSLTGVGGTNFSENDLPFKV